MRYAVCVLGGLLSACSAGEGAIPVGDADADTDADSDADADADTDADTDTDPAEYPEPTLLEVTCAVTANVLRYECTVAVEPAQPVSLTFARADGLSASRTVTGDDVLSSHVLPLHFMAPSQAYDVDVHAVEWPADVVSTSVTTAAAPGVVSSSLDMTGSSTMGMIGTNFPCASDAVAVVYDTSTGDLLWYQAMDPGGTFGPNDMVQFTDDHTVLGESEGDVIEVDLRGNDLVRLNNLDTAFGVTASGLFGNFHHDITKHDGVYYVIYQETISGGGFNADILDNLILFDATGTELARWYSMDHLSIPGNWSGDFLHTNTVFVDSSGDILLSFLNQDTVAKLDGDYTSASFGTVKWLLQGGDGDIGSTLDIDWSALGAPASFEDQHSVMIRADGQLQLLDNSHGRGLRIAIDEVASTATVLGEYETVEGGCGPQGTSRSTQAGNPVVGCSGDFVREYDLATATLLWEAEVQCPGGGGGFGDSGSSRWYPLDGW